MEGEQRSLTHEEIKGNLFSYFENKYPSDKISAAIDNWLQTDPPIGSIRLWQVAGLRNAVITIEAMLKTGGKKRRKTKRKSKRKKRRSFRNV